MAASSLNHPNIMTIHEIGQQDGNHFIAAEYIEGKSLPQHVAGSKLDLREMLGIASQILNRSRMVNMLASQFAGGITCPCHPVMPVACHRPVAQK